MHKLIFKILNALEYEQYNIDVIDTSDLGLGYDLILSVPDNRTVPNRSERHSKALKLVELFEIMKINAHHQHVYNLFKNEFKTHIYINIEKSSTEWFDLDEDGIRLLAVAV